MIGSKNSWKKLGLLAAPDPAVPWMSAWAGAAASEMIGESSFRIYMTGRDADNRSRIGSFRFDLEDLPALRVSEFQETLAPGEIGAFDENGVSYPAVVCDGLNTYLFYVGWMPSVRTPFQNHIGLARREADGAFHRVSRAPVLERNDDDFLSMGSCFAMIERGVWRLWYTAWTRWVPGESKPRHEYLIKYAESSDGRHWKRNNTVCIGFENPSEYAIARPSVLKIDGVYHLWYCHRGDAYRIGYAHSPDGIHWERRDDLAGIEPSPSGWDSECVCYPHVFRHKNRLYMLYNGNDYGRTGLGIAVRDL